MNWREHAWELVVSVLSWVVAFVALGGIVVMIGVDAVQRRMAQRKAPRPPQYPRQPPVQETASGLLARERLRGKIPGTDLPREVRP